MDDFEPVSMGFAPGELSSSLSEMRDLAATFAAELGGASTAMREMDGEARRLSRSLGSSLRSAFDKAVFGGGKFTDVLKGLGRDIAGTAFDAAIRPIQNSLGASLSGLFSGGIGSLLGFAQGGAFSSGRVRAFANGGVVDGPTYFPMRGGAGLMGEAGPEAIMPLSRGPDGKLGVRAQGGGAPQITVNISTPDLASFRQSRGQVAADLARAVQRGTRHL